MIIYCCLRTIKSSQTTAKCVSRKKQTHHTTQPEVFPINMIMNQMTQTRKGSYS